MPDNSSDFALPYVSWDAILQSIAEERCILCIGPGLYTELGVTLESRLADFLRAKSEQLRIRVYDDGWFHYRSGANSILPNLEVKNFYKQSFPRAQTLMSTIANINFHLIISLLPDYRLRNTFEELKIPHHFDAYIKKKPFDPRTIRPSAQLPLIYNLMGELNQRESMVLTHDDFYDYLESIFQGSSISPVLKNEIIQADNFIFLGLPFDRWYMHLFLRFLEQHRNKDLLKYALTEVEDEYVQTQCNEQFNITFVPFKFEQFLEELSQKCTEAGLSRKFPTTPAQETLSLFRKEIANDNLENVVNDFLSFVADYKESCSDLLDEGLLISGSIEHLNKQQRLNIIDYQEYGKDRARIRYGLLELMKQFEKRL